jgi:DNA mismatch repair protein MutL
VSTANLADKSPPLQFRFDNRVPLPYILPSGESPLSIRQLPEDLINRIAAGEVVERPSSVVKELVENAIDAGASRIVVTTAAGGKGLIRIEDDGHGMDRADLVLSVERHATSKLGEDELDDIRTLGFRGEALASIGSVAELSIASRTASAESGLRLEVRSGVRTGPVPLAMNRGTIVEVKNLFANVPARLKFLKTDRAEAGAITDVVKRLAMANPAVHFVLNGSDRSPANWPAVSGSGALEARLGQVMGADFEQNAVRLATSRHGVVVAGLAGLPTYTRANSLSQFYFVNGRSVKDKVLVGAVRAAYADYTFRDRFPVVALYIAIDPGEVDVNVHPAKAELRFRDAGAVRSAVIRAIGEALTAAGFKASTSVADDVLGAFTAPAYETAPVAPASLYGSSTAPFAGYERRAGTGSGNPFSPDFGQAAIHGLNEPSARIEPEAAPALMEYPLGTARAQMFDNFIIAQNGEGLLLVDQHAAHERLVYERFKAQLAAGPVPSQAQLIPLVVELPEEDCARLEDAAPELERFGLYLERFGPRAIAAREVPALLGNADIEGLVRDVADGLAEWDTSTVVADRMDEIIARMACHGSVRSGRRLRVDEMNALLRDMEATPHSGQCIHGRPTYVELKKKDIERLFGRSR